MFLKQRDKLVEAANIIKSNIGETTNISWPPQAEGIRSDTVRIPEELRIFLKTLLTNNTETSPRVQQLIESIGQDIIYNSSH